MAYDAPEPKRFVTYYRSMSSSSSVVVAAATTRNRQRPRDAFSTSPVSCPESAPPWRCRRSPDRERTAARS